MIIDVALDLKASGEQAEAAAQQATERV
jgi:hypothetical protein